MLRRRYTYSHTLRELGVGASSPESTRTAVIVKNIRKYDLNPAYKSFGDSSGKNLFIYSPEVFEVPEPLDIGPAAVVILSDGEEEEKMTVYDRFANKKSV